MVHNISWLGQVILLSHTCHFTPMCTESTAFLPQFLAAEVPVYLKRTKLHLQEFKTHSNIISEKLKKTEIVLLFDWKMISGRVIAASHSALRLSVCLSSLLLLISFLFFDIEQHRPNILQSRCISVPKLLKSSRVEWKLFLPRLHM